MVLDVCYVGLMKSQTANRHNLTFTFCSPAPLVFFCSSWVWVLEAAVCRAWHQPRGDCWGVCNRRNRQKGCFLLSGNWFQHYLIKFMTISTHIQCIFSLYPVVPMCKWSATPLSTTRWSDCSADAESYSDHARAHQPPGCAVSPSNTWLFIKLIRLMTSTTSPEQFSWIWSRGWSTPSSTLPMQTCTTQRTSTSLSTAEVLGTTGPADIHRWSLNMTFF